jgi:hypothetical protein
MEIPMTEAKTKEISIDELWESSPTSDDTFNPELLTNLPHAVRLYKFSRKFTG